MWATLSSIEALILRCYKFANKEKTHPVSSLLESESGFLKKEIMKCYGENIVMLGIPSSRQNFPRVSEQEDLFPVPIRYSGHAHFSGRGLLPSFSTYARTFPRLPQREKEGGGEKESLHTAQLSTLSAPFSSHPLSFSAILGPIPKKGVLPQTSTTPVFSPTAAFFFPFFSLSLLPERIVPGEKVAFKRIADMEDK